MQLARSPARPACAHRRIGSSRARACPPGRSPLRRDPLAALSGATPVSSSRPGFSRARLRLQSLRVATADRCRERPQSLALAAASGGARSRDSSSQAGSTTSFESRSSAAIRAVPAGVRTLCLSLFMLGLIDTVALAPLAFAAAPPPGPAPRGAHQSRGHRRGRSRGARCSSSALPRLLASRRLGAPARPLASAAHHVVSRSLHAWALVSTCWVDRARRACCSFLARSESGSRFPLALLFLCASSAAAALPVGPGRRSHSGRRGRSGAHRVRRRDVGRSGRRRCRPGAGDRRRWVDPALRSCMAHLPVGDDAHRPGSPCPFGAEHRSAPRRRGRLRRYRSVPPG